MATSYTLLANLKAGRCSTPLRFDFSGFGRLGISEKSLPPQSNLPCLHPISLRWIDTSMDSMTLITSLPPQSNLPCLHPISLRWIDTSMDSMTLITVRSEVTTRSGSTRKKQQREVQETQEKSFRAHNEGFFIKVESMCDYVLSGAVTSGC
ncbi:hypothetical protein DY000_02020242 [Brassica cretica]|uniref:Uncharacterized protein n=1 Tax=Brassica cretica TaxID=69181 RepID=A0ABQ7E849_BRACR|nr:hypothetical protein DY000_02020242 [Brassica cretica]